MDRMRAHVRYVRTYKYEVSILSDLIQGFVFILLIKVQQMHVMYYFFMEHVIMLHCIHQYA